MKTLMLCLLCAIGLRVSAQQTTQPAFVAMQYKGLSNCIYKVYVSPELIIGVRVNGYIAEGVSFGMGTVIPHDKRKDPQAYIKLKLDERYPADVIADTVKVKAADKQNFVIQRKAVIGVSLNTEPKWGMGGYPYTGRIMLEYTSSTGKKAEMELILIGDQPADAILKEFKED